MAFECSIFTLLIETRISSRLSAAAVVEAIVMHGQLILYCGGRSGSL